MQFSDENVDYVLKDGDWLCNCNIGFGCSGKKIVCNVKQRHIFLRDLTFIYKKKRLYLLVYSPRVVYYWLKKTQK